MKKLPCLHSLTRLVCVLLLVLGVACSLTGCFLSKEEPLTGTWETQNGEMMVITETDFIIQGISFPYELSSRSRSGEQEFVVVAGSLGALRGSYRIQNGVLYITIDGAEEQFTRR